MNEAVIEKLKFLAQKKCHYYDNDKDDDEFTVYDICGGNVDDAFALGEQSGEIMLAREILTMLEIDYSSN